MDKIEFLTILKQSLNGEVSGEVIEQNVRYYDSYISAETVEAEADIIDRLGGPRLIAKTIIEAEKAAKEKGMNHWSGANYQDRETEAKEEFNRNTTSNMGHSFFTNMKWYHKLIAVLTVILLFVIIAVIGRLMIGFIFTFGLPILLVLTVLSLTRKR